MGGQQEGLNAQSYVIERARLIDEILELVQVHIAPWGLLSLLSFAVIPSI